MATLFGWLLGIALFAIFLPAIFWFLANPVLAKADEIIGTKDRSNQHETPAWLTRLFGG